MKKMFMFVSLGLMLISYSYADDDNADFGLKTLKEKGVSTICGSGDRTLDAVRDFNKKLRSFDGQIKLVSDAILHQHNGGGPNHIYCAVVKSL